MTDQEDLIGRFKKRRYGACHRCGWSGAVAKVGRRERRLLKSGHEFGRLCDECVGDLIHDDAKDPELANRRPVKRRHVA
jgi:hypothetical protein